MSGIFYHEDYLKWIRDPKSWKTPMSEEELQQIEKYEIAWAEIYPSLQPWMRQQYRDPLEDPKKKPVGRPKTTAPYAWVTINFPPSTQVRRGKEALERLCEAVWIKDYQYVFEQRGNTLETMGTGFHCHLLLETDKTKSQVLQLMMTSIGKACGLQDNSIHYMPCTEADKPKREKYMSGQKTPDKLEKCKIDLEFRKKYFLKDKYINEKLQVFKEEKGRTEA